jgi:CheY-like chemotaxis protein
MSIDFHDENAFRREHPPEECGQPNDSEVVSKITEVSDAVQEALILQEGIVMVVEDDPNLLCLFPLILKGNAVQDVIGCENPGKALLELCDPARGLTGKMPHLVLSDTEMPGMKGDALFEEMDALFESLGIPLADRPFYAAMSGNFGAPQNKSSLQYYLSKKIPLIHKPFSMEELENQVTSLLKRHPKFHRNK